MYKNLIKAMNKLTMFSLIVLFASCGGNPEGDQPQKEIKNLQSGTTENGNPSYDPHRGEGKFSEVKIADKLDEALAASGEKIAGVKCTSCHKPTEEKLVGPGWKGVTSRRNPGWIMNFITNPDPMIDKDPALQAQLELCLVRMPNQNLADQDARDIVEYMRKIDGVK
jgi:mono/diheme cytochrome c family protein